MPQSLIALWDFGVFWLNSLFAMCCGVTASSGAPCGLGDVKKKRTSGGSRGETSRVLCMLIWDDIGKSEKERKNECKGMIAI